jgi:23S rRNA (uracil1939-C5)-methyltransferase
MLNRMQIELVLTEMVYGGNALAKLDGRPIFVKGGLPGERVSALITRDHGRYAFAVVTDVLEASPQRVVPRCPYFRAGTCGGCQWQHIDYAAQVEYKTAIVREQFRRIGKLPDAPVRPMIASPEAWFYRTHVTFQRAPGGELGFVAPDDRTITPINECYIIRPELLALKDAITGDARRVRCIVGADGSESAVSRLHDPTEKSTAPDGQLDDDTPGSASSGDKVTFTIHGETFRVSAGSFFQVNLAQAARLVELVIDHLNLTGNESTLDLYSGVGLFTAFLALGAKRVTAIEQSSSAVIDAQLNLARYANVKIIEAAVEDALPRLEGKFAAAVIDPPRAGMKPDALAALLEHAPRRIAYVACDPSTLARDARQLVSAGYTLTHVQPVDMFPHTYHIECVAGFEKT